MAMLNGDHADSAYGIVPVQLLPNMQWLTQISAPIAMSTQDSLGRAQGPLAFRKPQRISITVPQSVYDFLLMKSSYEGRSLSNYASYLLERSATEK